MLRRTSTNADGTFATTIGVVPLHRRDLAIGTLASVLRQAGVDGDTFIELADRVSSSSEAISDNLIVDFDE